MRKPVALGARDIVANARQISGGGVKRPTHRPLRLLSATSECYPLIKTGGLADVAGALPKALLDVNIETRTLLPGYPLVLEKLEVGRELCRLRLLGQDAAVAAGHFDGLDILVLICPALFERSGGPYLDSDGRDHPDNWLRFAALSRATAQVAAGCLPGWQPDLVQLHDWQTALAALYMRAYLVPTPTVLTIHNLSFQGQFPAGIFPALELPGEMMSTHLEYYGDISFLKAGIAACDAMTTVSPTYAREILTKPLGMGMDGILFTRRDALRGIVNGIDRDVWNPKTDPYIPFRYDTRTVSRRGKNRAALLGRFALSDHGGPVLSVISRLTWQKGVDLLPPIIPGIVDRDATLIVYGQGDPAILVSLKEQAARYPGRVAVHDGFNEADAHLLHAGSDIVIQPSRFEPCGLTQLYALRYGAIPIVARTGGLAETIIDANEAAMAARVATGFHFEPGSVGDLYHAVDRALVAFTDPAFWRRLQSQAMKANFGWERSAPQYARLYRTLLMKGATAFPRSAH